MNNRHLVNAQVDLNRAVFLMNAINNPKTLQQINFTTEEATMAINLYITNVILTLTAYQEAKP